jgi:uncharacterized membrane protein
LDSDHGNWDKKESFLEPRRLFPPKFWTGVSVMDTTTIATGAPRGIGKRLAAAGFGWSSTVGPWKVQPSLTLTIIAFFDTLKYPPSLDYLLMTLGPAQIVLACLDGVAAERGLGRILLVFGRVSRSRTN